MSTEEKLRVLGDPSGKQDSKYWNEWFQVVCGDDHRSFEWYTDPSEVARVLRSCNCADVENPRMIHPGSGNSLTPVKLRDDYSFPHKHVVVDIANVALEEMKQVHDKLSNIENTSSIEYLLGNVLNPPLPLDDNSFDVWVDKGLLDALFKDFETSSISQCNTLFEEAHRLLRPGFGLLLVVTMAEDHSLLLILDNWGRLLKEGTAGWTPHLTVHELEPVSGDMRPFGFTMTKALSDVDAKESDKAYLMWHPIIGAMEQLELGDDAFDIVKIRCEQSRQEFRSKLCKSDENMMLATIEIKPWDAEVDLNAVGQLVTGADWVLAEGRPICPKWQPFDENGREKIKIVPVGYGISKLVLKCVIDSDDLDNFTEALREWDGGGIAEDGVQSVDVDWDKTFRIVDLPSIASVNRS
jgi:translation elongation factor EF-1beta